MDIDITRLRSGIVSKIEVNETYKFNEEELKTLEITALDDLKIEGNISLDALKEVYLDLVITGTMIIPCAVWNNRRNWTRFREKLSKKSKYT